ncbi:hypothetical protein IV203_021650 [Nitzschia inconspicua]|uniref:Uncharacterized protein n=1 Tax=Nitzschia inconspicua TaxID=303405 RepID=A0A9K3KHE1_9STRA|nr:hypothetical protein IV203_021650 [Nitzschia inconspicua]
MNNPEDKFMSPMSRPPASKKQRGGTTPRPSGTTMMMSSSTSSSNAGPPPPFVPNTTGSTATRTGRLTSTAEDAIARRRAELRRLQAKRTAAASGSTAGTTNTSISATTSTTNAAAAAANTTIASNVTSTTGGGPPPPPMRSAGVQRHHSDLFPTVPKSPSPQVTRQTLLDVSEATGAPTLAFPNQQQPPALPAQTEALANNRPPPTIISDSTAIKVPSTPTVNRKLEFPSSQKGSMTLETTNSAETRTRSKSAPPSRPPPPPPPKNVPSSATGGAASAASKPSSRSNIPTGRPPSDTTDIPFSRTAERAQARKEREASHPHQEANSPHLIPSTKTISTSISAPPMATPQVATHNNKTTSSSSSPPISLPMPSSTKREKINMMRNAVAETEAQPAEVPSNKDEPPTPPRRLARSPPDGTISAVATADSAEASATVTSESEKRLEEAYQKAEREKTAALVKIKQLEDQLLQAQDKVAKAEQLANKLPPPGSNSNIDFQYMLQLAETDGPEAAMAWVKSQPPAHNQNQGGTPRKGGGVGSLTAMSPLRNVVAGLRDSPRKRFKSLSDRSMSINPVIPNLPPDVPMKQIEKQLLSQFREAVQYVPFEFTSPLATYVVRRPYGNITAPDLFQYISPMPDDVYMKRAHVSTLAALEVGVTILADNSVMLLFDKAGVRYNKNSTSDGGWKMIPNVEELDRPLGFVTYIDEQAKELEYSLDDIVEEAMLVREQYSSSMINTALSLKDRPPAATPAAVEAAEVPSLAKAPSKDVGTETDEKGMMTAPTMSITVENIASADDTTKPAAAADSTSPPAEDISGSSDVLTVFMGMILSSVFGLIYSVMIGLPLRIVQTVFVMTVVYALVNMMYLYLADDYNDWLVRETDGTVSHQDLAYFSNTRRGIL